MHVLWFWLTMIGTVGKEQLSNLKMEKKMVLLLMCPILNLTHLSQPSETVERSHSLAKASGHWPHGESCIFIGKLLVSPGSSN